MRHGWRSRGYLPHCDERGLVQHIVFGLHDGFRAPPPIIVDPTARALWADKEFDRNHGSRLLVPNAPLSEVLQQWKSISAHAINEAERRHGPLWQREYFDRFMRSEQQFEWTVNYVENNPVAAGLVERPENWRFSSAAFRRNVAGEGAGAP